MRIPVPFVVLPLLLLALPACTDAAGTVLQPNDVQIVAFASDAPDAMVSRDEID
jgi:hypothetical protein